MPFPSSQFHEQKIHSYHQFSSVSLSYSCCALTKVFMCVVAAQSCLILGDSMNCSPADSSVHGIFQARILEWVAMPSSRESSQPRDQTCISYVFCIGRWVLYHLRHQGSPNNPYLPQILPDITNPHLCHYIPSEVTPEVRGYRGYCSMAD